MKVAVRGATALLILVSLYTIQSTAKPVSIMAYNVENFFDTKHDEGTEDWTYLPLEMKKASEEAQKYCQSISNPHYKEDCLTIDWNEEAMANHIRNSARVIKSYDNGAGPDIVILEEIENLNTVNHLADKGLT